MVSLKHIISLLLSLSLFSVNVIFSGFNIKIRLTTTKKKKNCLLNLKSIDPFKMRKQFWVIEGKSHLNRMDMTLQG